MADTAAVSGRVLLDAEGVRGAVEQMAARLRPLVREPESAALVGIRRRGVPLAERLQSLLAPERPESVALGEIDITLHRDDLSALGAQPVVGRTDLPFDVDDRVVILVDDVLFTGRTVRAALEALVAFGRPRAVRLAVLVDRGNREYPIQPDVVGLTVKTDPGDDVRVQLVETDGQDLVAVMRP